MTLTTERSVAHIGDEIAVRVPALSHREACMCERCKEIDLAIERYRRLAKEIDNKTMLESINTSIETLEAEKRALHSDLKK